MKLIVAIVNRDDAGNVADALRRDNFHFTRLASSGGFLLSGNVTFLCGVPDERRATAVEIIRSRCRNRAQQIPEGLSGQGFFPAAAVEVQAGGATIFVLDVEQFERL